MKHEFCGQEEYLGQISFRVEHVSGTPLPSPSDGNTAFHTQEPTNQLEQHAQTSNTILIQFPSLDGITEEEAVNLFKCLHRSGLKYDTVTNEDNRSVSYDGRWMKSNDDKNENPS